MANLTYCDEIDPTFGVPWPEDMLRYNRGKLACALSPAEVDALSDEQVVTMNNLLKNQPASEKEDPIKWGWTLPSWRRVMENWKDVRVHVILGGNRSSKSVFATRMLMHLAQRIPEAELRSMHVSEERSIQDSQRYVWDAMPMRYKRAQKKSEQHSILYSAKNGFSDNKCIMPVTHEGADRGSSIFFNNYRQYAADSQIFEGWSAHCIHCDEEINQSIFETLLARLTDHKGRLILTFTTLQGWTPLINTLLKGAETIETRYSKLIGKELPVEQVCRNWPDTHIYYWRTAATPFIDGEDLIKTYSKQPLEVKLARLYGIPSKNFHGRFPRFNRDVNVVAHDDVPFIADGTERVTRYMICDPGGSKPWVAIWAAVMPDGRVYVYREFPEASMGEWALPHVNNAGRSTGKPGPAQRPLGWGYEDYRDHFEELESGEDIFERIVDPRMGAATVRTKEGTSNIINSMGELGFIFRAAPGVDIEAGIARVNNLLAWDDSEPLTEENRPRLYVSDRCENLITCLMEYTGSGNTEQFKDFIDCLRYFCICDPEHVTNSMLACTGGGGY